MSMQPGPGYGPVGGPGFAAVPGPPVAGPQPHPGGSGKPPKDKTPKSARKLASTNGAIAAGLGIAAFVLILLFLGGAKGESHFVVRAKTTLPALAPVTASQLEAVEVPKNLVEPKAITAGSADEAMKQATSGDSAIVGLAPKVNVLAGQQVRPEMFSVQMDLETPLQPEERLISISADVARGLAGNLGVGDHVDVIVVDENGKQAGVVLQDAEIVAVSLPGQALEAAAQQQTTASGRDSAPSEVLPANPIPGTYVLRVPADRVTVLAVADSTGSVYLVYRGAGATPLGGGARSLDDAVCGGVCGPAPEAADQVPGADPPQGDL